MKRREWNVISAGVLSASLLLGSSCPVWAADQSEVPAADAVVVEAETQAAAESETSGIEQESEGGPGLIAGGTSGETELPGIIGESETELTDRQIPGDALHDQGPEKGTVKVEFSDAMLARLGADAGEDFSWMRSVTGTGTAMAGENGKLDFSGEYLLNDGHVADCSLSFDPETGDLYVLMPELNQTPMVVNVADFMKKTAEVSGGDGLQQVIPQETLSKLGEDAGKLFASLTPEDFEKFAGRYAGSIAAACETTQTAGVEVSAGDLKGQVTETTVTISPENMKDLLKKSVTTLRDDELILKVIRSDLAGDILDFALTQSGAPGGVSLTPDDLVISYQDALDSMAGSLDKANVPGFSFTVGNDSEGVLASFNMHVIYSGVDMPLFTYVTLKDGDRNATELNLGEMIASALLGSGEDGGEAPEESGRTGILAEGTTAGDMLNEIVSVNAQGKAVLTAELENFDQKLAGKGFLTGHAALSVQDQKDLLQVDFTHPDDDSQAVAVTVNGNETVTVTVTETEGDAADIKAIDPASAVRVTTEDDFDSYMADFDPAQLEESLSAAGMPQDLLDQIFDDEDETRSETTTAA